MCVMRDEINVKGYGRQNGAQDKQHFVFKSNSYHIPSSEQARFACLNAIALLSPRSLNILDG